MNALQNDLLPINRRTQPRFAYREPFVVWAGGRTLRVVAYNISANGLCGEIQGLGSLPEGCDVEIYLHDYPAVSGRVRWARGREVGLIFTENIDNHPRIGALVARMGNGEAAASTPPG